MHQLNPYFAKAQIEYRQKLLTRPKHPRRRRRTLRRAQGA